MSARAARGALAAARAERILHLEKGKLVRETAPVPARPAPAAETGVLAPAAEKGGPE